MTTIYRLLVGGQYIRLSPLPSVGAEASVAAGAEVIDFEYGELLGQGNHGRVFQAKYRLVSPGREPYVIKVGTFTEDERARNSKYYNYEKEIAAFTVVHGKQPILHYEDVGAGRKTYRILMPALPGVTLEKYLRDNRGNYLEQTKILIAVLKAVKSMHDKGVIHGDLKPSNINIEKDAVTGEYRVSILDFGQSYRLEESAFSSGTLSCEYWTRDRVQVAPEVIIAAHPYQDIFSLFYILSMYDNFIFNLIKEVIPSFVELQESQQLLAEIRTLKIKLKEIGLSPARKRELEESLAPKQQRVDILYENRRRAEASFKDIVTVDGLIAKAESLLNLAAELKEYCLTNFNIFSRTPVAEIKARLKIEGDEARANKIEQIDDRLFEEIKALCQKQLIREVDLFLLANKELANVSIEIIRDRLLGNPIFEGQIFEDAFLVQRKSFFQQYANYINRLLSPDTLELLIRFENCLVAEFNTAIPREIKILYTAVVKTSLMQADFDNLVTKAKRLLPVCNLCKSKFKEYALLSIEDSKLKLKNEEGFNAEDIDQIEDSFFAKMKQTCQNELTREIKIFLFKDENSGFADLSIADFGERLEVFYEGISRTYEDYSLSGFQELLRTRQEFVDGVLLSLKNLESIVTERHVALERLINRDDIALQYQEVKIYFTPENLANLVTKAEKLLVIYHYCKNNFHTFAYLEPGDIKTKLKQADLRVSNEEIDKTSDIFYWRVKRECELALNKEYYSYFLDDENSDLVSLSVQEIKIRMLTNPFFAEIGEFITEERISVLKKLTVVRLDLIKKLKTFNFKDCLELARTYNDIIQRNKELYRSLNGVYSETVVNSLTKEVWDSIFREVGATEELFQRIKHYCSRHLSKFKNVTNPHDFKELLISVSEFSIDREAINELCKEDINYFLVLYYKPKLFLLKSWLEKEENDIALCDIDAVREKLRNQPKLLKILNPEELLFWKSFQEESFRARRAAEERIKDELRALCLKNFVTIVRKIKEGQSIKNYLLAVSDNHEDLINFIARLPERFFTEVQEICQAREKAVKDWLYKDSNKDIKDLEIDAIKTRVKENPDFSAYADEIDSALFEMCKLMVKQREEKISIYISSLNNLLTILKHKNHVSSLSNWKNFLSSDSLPEENLESYTEESLNRIKAAIDSYLDSQADSRLFYTTYPGINQYFDDRFKAILNFINIDSVNGDKKTSIAFLISGLFERDTSFESTQNRVWFVYEAYCKLSSFEKIVVKSALNLPIETTELAGQVDPLCCFILRPGFNAKEFLRDLLTVIEAMPRKRAGLWTATHAALHDATYARLLMLHQGSKEKTNDQPFAYLVLQILTEYRQHLKDNHSVSSLRRLNEFLVTKAAPKTADSTNYQFIVDKTGDGVAVLCRKLIDLIQAMPKTSASSSWFAATHSRLNAEIIVRLEDLQKSVIIDKAEFSRILTDYRARLLTGKSVRSLRSLDEFILKEATPASITRREIAT